MKFAFKFLPIVVLALVLGGWAIWSGAGSIFEGYVSSSWPKTTGTIQQSSLGRRPVIIYDYTVDGHSYQGSRIDTRWAWNDASTRQVVDAYPSGSQRPVYYSPSAPGDSILITGIHCRSFFGLVLGTLILSVGTLFGIMGYLAPKYGTTHGGRSYAFDNNSPVAPIAIFGMIIIICQFGLLFWIGR